MQRPEITHGIIVSRESHESHEIVLKLWRDWRDLREKRILPQTETVQRPRHQVIFGMCPTETMFQWILPCRPKSLNDFHVSDVFCLLTSSRFPDSR